MIVVPAIDLRGGKVVRLRQGRAEEETIYSDSPGDAARRWVAEGALRLHVVDLDAAIDGKPQPEVVAALIAAAGIPVEVGGGIRSVEDAQRYINAGADRVIFGTAAIARPEVVQEAVRRFPGAVAVAIDAKDGRVAVKGWTEATDVTALELALRVAAWGVPRIQYTDISRDGTLVGPNVHATAEVARVSGLRVTAAGGVSRLEDVVALAAVEKDGVDEAISGKALYDGRFTLREAQEAACSPRG